MYDEEHDLLCGHDQEEDKITVYDIIFITAVIAMVVILIFAYDAYKKAGGGM